MLTLNTLYNLAEHPNLRLQRDNVAQFLSSVCWCLLITLAKGIDISKQSTNVVVVLFIAPIVNIISFTEKY